MRLRLVFFSQVVFTFVATTFFFCLQVTSADVLEADEKLQWRRGNMHTHSLWSDGDDYLEMIALCYRDLDYDFLVFSDHNVLANTERWIDVAKSKGGSTAYGKFKVQFPKLVKERVNQEGKLEVQLHTFQQVAEHFNQPNEFLLIQGEEISDSFEKIPIHLNVSNVVDSIPPMRGVSVFDTIQNNVRAAHAQREQTGQPMIIHLNHPNFHYAVTAEELARVVGEQFFEVYNGSTSVNDTGDDEHVSTERIWDIVLTQRLAELHLPLMFGLATDDSHEYQQIPNRGSAPGRGWVMVLTNELSTVALIEALEEGRFYSSSGVKMKRLETSSTSYSVEIEPVEGETYTIEFIGTRRGYDASSDPVLDKEGKEIHTTRHYSHDIGETLKKVEGTTAAYHFSGDEIYVRVRITSSAKHPDPSEPGEPKQAWCQPLVGPAGK